MESIGTQAEKTPFYRNLMAIIAPVAATFLSYGSSADQNAQDIGCKIAKIMGTPPSPWPSRECSIKSLTIPA